MGALENRALVNDDSSWMELNLEAQWIVDTLTSVLNQKTKKLRVCARSKRWLYEDLNKAQLCLKTTRRQFQQKQITLGEYKIARNLSYRKIRKARDSCSEQ